LPPDGTPLSDVDAGIPETVTLALAMPGSARQPAAATIKTAAADRNFRCIHPVPCIKCMAPA
jgi:hypothetical protein